MPLAERKAQRCGGALGGHSAFAREYQCDRHRSETSETAVPTLHDAGLRTISSSTICAMKLLINRLVIAPARHRRISTGTGPHEHGGSPLPHLHRDSLGSLASTQICEVRISIAHCCAAVLTACLPTGGKHRTAYLLYTLLILSGACIGCAAQRIADLSPRIDPHGRRHAHESKR